MTDRKFIMVLGLPRGGTSLVAKMLIELGVNMGERFLSSKPYPNWEDSRFHECVHGYAAWNDEQKRADCVKRVRDYMHKRLDEVDGPVGAKFPCISNLYGAEGWDTLPIRVVRVVRPLDEVIRSDLYKYTCKDGGRKRRLNRAAEYGRIWYSQQEFCKHYVGEYRGMYSVIEHGMTPKRKVQVLQSKLQNWMCWPNQPSEGLAKGEYSRIADEEADRVVEASVSDKRRTIVGRENGYLGPDRTKAIADRIIAECGDAS